MTMPYIPVDPKRLTVPVCVAAPEVRMNPETGEARTDRDGRPVYLVGVAMRRAGTRKAFVIDVATSDEPIGIVEGTPVRLVDLEAVPWEIDGRHGMSYRAAAVQLYLPSTPAAASPAASANPSNRKGADA